MGYSVDVAILCTQRAVSVCWARPGLLFFFFCYGLYAGQGEGLGLYMEAKVKALLFLPFSHFQAMQSRNIFLSLIGLYL